MGEKPGLLVVAWREKSRGESCMGQETCVIWSVRQRAWKEVVEVLDLHIVYEIRKCQIGVGYDSYREKGNDPGHRDGGK